MSDDIIVYKGRTNVIGVSLGMDVSGETFTSEIRKAPNREATLIAAWTVTFATTGVDGELLLTMDNSITTTIEDKTGYMDLKRMSGTEPLPVFDRALPVIFRDTVTI